MNLLRTPQVEPPFGAQVAFGRVAPGLGWMGLGALAVGATAWALFGEPGALGGPADPDGREDDHEGDYDGVDKLGGQGSSRLTQEHGKEQLDGLVPSQSCHQP